MLTALLTRLSRGWRLVPLVLLALLWLPAQALAIGYTDVVEAFRYSYGSDKMILLMAVETVLFNLLKRKKKRVGGRGQWITPYETQNSGVFVGMGEGGALTTLRGQPDSKEATYSLVEFQGVWDVTWKMLRAAARSEDAFISALKFGDQSIRRRILRVINAQLCSFTGLGELGIMPDADDQTTITVNSLPFVDKGQYVDLMDASDNTTKLASARKATSLNTASRTITIDGAAPSGTAAGDYFVPAGQIAGGVSYSISGIGAWASDQNPPSIVPYLGGINRATPGNEDWQATVRSNGGTLRAFTEDLLIDGENDLRERGAAQPDRYLGGNGIFKRYHGDLVKDRYFAMNTIESPDKGKIGMGREGVDLSATADGTGGTNYTLSGKPCHIEPYFRANRVIGWRDENLFIGHDGVEMPAPISEVFDGMVSHFTNTDYAKFDIWHYWEAQLIATDPRELIQFADLAES